MHGADAWNFLCGEDTKKLTFSVYKNILLDIKDMREK